MEIRCTFNSQSLIAAVALVAKIQEIVKNDVALIVPIYACQQNISKDERAFRFFGNDN